MHRETLAAYAAKLGVRAYVLGLLLAQLPSDRLRDHLRSRGYVTVYTQMRPDTMETSLVVSVTIGMAPEFRVVRPIGFDYDYARLVHETAMLSPADLISLMFLLNREDAA